MRVGSVCSGAGGMDLGLEQAGMKTVFFCELDKQATGVLQRHWPEVPVFPDLRDLYGSSTPAIDILVGGTPCQDFSVAGSRSGMDGEKSGLLRSFLRLAEETSADWVLWENVDAVLHRTHAEDFAAVLASFTGFHPKVPADGWRTAGGCVGPKGSAVWRVLDAQHFGVPQQRKRLFLVVRFGEVCCAEILLEPCSVCRDSAPSRPQGEVSSTITAGSPGSGGYRLDDGQLGQLQLARPLKANENLSFDDSQDTIVLHESQITSNQNRSVARRGGPAPTLNQDPRTICYSYQQGTLQPRRLTPLECERMQGFPDFWTRWDDKGRELSDSARYRLVGNAVCLPVATWIARRILAFGEEMRVTA